MRTKLEKLNFKFETEVFTIPKPDNEVESQISKSEDSILIEDIMLGQDLDDIIQILNIEKKSKI